jgi:hypothetical protein
MAYPKGRKMIRLGRYQETITGNDSDPVHDTEIRRTVDQDVVVLGDLFVLEGVRQQTMQTKPLRSRPGLIISVELAREFHVDVD